MFVALDAKVMERCEVQCGDLEHWKVLCVWKVGATTYTQMRTGQFP